MAKTHSAGSATACPDERRLRCWLQQRRRRLLARTLYPGLQDARKAVTELLKSLPDAQRTAVVLKYLSPTDIEPEEITYQQIAEKLNKPVGTVKSEVSRAMHHMRKQLTEQHIIGGNS